jgi:hypothetical protein
MSDETIICAHCDEYASERRDDFDWELGVPICAHCMVENDPETVVGFGFQAAFDRMTGATMPRRRSFTSQLYPAARLGATARAFASGNPTVTSRSVPSRRGRSTP